MTLKVWFYFLVAILYTVCITICHCNQLHGFDGIFGGRDGSGSQKNVLLEKESVTKVHVVFNNHLDVGFTGLITQVINSYFDEFYFRAIEVAKHLREKHGKNFIYTTQSWILSLFFDCPSSIWPELHCPNQTAIDTVKAGILRGEITWHAFPFNSQMETYEPSMIDAGFLLTHDLDRLFGQEKKMTYCQRDIPGTTRSLIPILLKNGIKAITVGVNVASAPPDVPKVFWWKDKVSGQKILSMFHSGGYGGLNIDDAVYVPGFPEVMIFDIDNDNDGPQSLEQALQTYSILQKEYPNAIIEASTIDTFVKKLMQNMDLLEQQLPIISQEIGDTWVYGTASDPLKQAKYRIAAKLRLACIEDKICNPLDKKFKEFDRMLLKLGEHTFGLDIPRYLHDFVNWSNKQFNHVRHESNFQFVEQSWYEQRSIIDKTLKTLDDSFPLKRNLVGAFEQISHIKTPSLEGFERIVTLNQTFEIGRFTLQFDEITGSIIRLDDQKTKKKWASPENPLATILYQTFDEKDYKFYLDDYIYERCMNCLEEFDKSNVSLASPVHGEYHPHLESLWTKKLNSSQKFVLFLTSNKEQHETYGSPSMFTLEIDVPSKQNTKDNDIYISMKSFNKTATRLPESLWLSFNPIFTDKEGWYMDKLGELVSPTDVILNGSQHQHATLKGVMYRESDMDQKPKTVLTVYPVHSPVVGFGLPTPFPSPLRIPPDVTKGFHFNIYNNIWGTNFIMWYPFDEANDKNIQSDFILQLHD